MHPGTQAFNADPENARLADDYAIVMGTSHCEQMLRNNEDEWKKVGIYDDFNYFSLLGGESKTVNVSHLTNENPASKQFKPTITIEQLR